LLARAKACGLIPALRPYVDNALAAGVGYGAEFVQRVLAAANE